MQKNILSKMHPTKEPLVPMVDLKAVYKRMETELRQAVVAAAEGGIYFHGENVRHLEDELAADVGTTYAITCANATDALTLALMSLDIKPLDEVIAPSICSTRIAEAARCLSINVIFADIDPKSFNIDPKDAEAKVTPRTRAIIPSHLFGRMANMDAVLDVAQRHNLFVIEDAAQSFGAQQSVRGARRMAGSVGIIGCTSFSPTQNLACMGNGGALFTNSYDVAKRIRTNRETAGLDSHLDELQAAILRIKLRHLDEMLSRRRSAALAYRKALANNDFYVLPEFADGHSFNQFTLRVNYGCRDDVREFLSQRGIASEVNSSPVHPLPAAIKAADEVLSIPLHSEISPDTVSRVSLALNDWHIGANHA